MGNKAQFGSTFLQHSSLPWTVLFHNLFEFSNKSELRHIGYWYSSSLWKDEQDCSFRKGFLERYAKSDETANFPRKIYQNFHFLWKISYGWLIFVQRQNFLHDLVTFGGKIYWIYKNKSQVLLLTFSYPPPPASIPLGTTFPLYLWDFEIFLL